MKWSYSQSKIFLQCQRRWFFNYYVASWNAKNKFRREAYILTQLYSIYAWRGKIVDYVIEKKIIPEILKKHPPDYNQVKDFALNLFEKQYEFAKNQLYRKNQVTKTSVGENFCALKEIEFEQEIDNITLNNLKNDILSSLRNLLRSNLILDLIENSIQIYAQEILNFKFEGVNVVCIPDLVVLYDEKPPLIIDWKVHQYANSTAKRQLLTYAYVYYHLNSTNNSNLNNIKDIRLMEYQLLKNYQWSYSIKPEDVLETEDYIFQTSSQMRNLIKGRKYNQLEVSEFKTAASSKICINCNYKILCWKKKLKQQSLWDF